MKDPMDEVWEAAMKEAHKHHHQLVTMRSFGARYRWNIKIGRLHIGIWRIK